MCYMTKKNKNTESCETWKLYRICILLSINKVLLKHSHAHLFMTDFTQ